MYTEYYKYGLCDIGKLMCTHPYLNKEEVDKDHRLYWTIDPVTLNLWSFFPSFIKNRVLEINHAYNTLGVFTFKPESK